MFKFNSILTFIFLTNILFTVTAQEIQTQNKSLGTEPGNVFNRDSKMGQMTNPQKGNYFILNKGQWPQEVKFLVKFGGMDAWITKTGIVYDYYQIQNPQVLNKNTTFALPTESPLDRNLPFDGHVIKTTFINSDSHSDFQGKNLQVGSYNYFIGMDQSKTANNVPIYNAVLVEGLYEGVDVRYYFDNGFLRYDFIVKPNTDIKKIKMLFEGAEGVSVIDGTLKINTSLGTVLHKDIVAYQSDKQIPCSFTLDSENHIGFSMVNYDKNKELIIDPLVFSTFLGGSQYDVIYGMAVNSLGNAFIAGYTYSSNYPTTVGAYSNTFHSPDMFVTKFNDDGSDLIYSTFIGGNDAEWATSVAVDQDGNAYILGTCRSLDFPVTLGVYDATYNGGHDLTVTKLNPSGSSLIYSTFIGGNNFDQGSKIAINSNGNAVVTGATYSTDYPVTSGAFDESHNGDEEIMVTQLNADGTAVLHSTFIGGSNRDSAADLFIDINGNVYLTGYTNSLNFPTTPGTLSETYGGGDIDGFILKLNASASALIYSTYLGGGLLDATRSIAVDNSGNAFVTGLTESNDFPVTIGAYDETYNGNPYDAFVSKINPTGTALVYSSFLGGAGQDDAGSITIDNAGNAFIAGQTYSTNFPITADAFDNTLGGPADAFICKLNISGSNLLYSTYLGGSSPEWSQYISVDHSGNVFVGGSTSEADFPTTVGAFDESFNGNTDIFLTKLYESAFLETLPPVLLTPTNTLTAVSITPSFSWSSVTGMTSYNLQIATDENFGTNLLDFDLATNSYTLISALLNGTPYYWRVRASDGTTTTDYSTVWGFTTIIAPPVPIHPAAPFECCISIDDAISWSPVTGAIKYGLTFSDDPNFNNIIYDGDSKTNGTETIWTFSQLANDAVYYYKLRAFDGNQWIQGEVNSFRTLLPQVPILNYPTAGTIVYTQNPYFSWNYTSGATGLTSLIQVASNASFTSGLQSATALVAPYLWPTALMYGQQYWWRVISKNAAGNVISYSASTNFSIYGSISLPVASWPVQGATVYTNTPTLYWYAPNAINGTQYMYHYQKVGDATWDRANTWTTGFSAVLPQLESGTAYRWSVKLFDGYDSSAFTDPETFITNGEGTLVVPKSSWPVVWGSSVPTVYTCSPTVNWYTGTNTAGLTFEVGYGEDPNPENWTEPFISVPAGLSAVIPGLTCGTTYYWAARSVNDATHSAWGVSPLGKFTLFGSVADVKPTCSYPVGNAIVYSKRPSLNWYSGASGVSYYTIHYNAGTGWVDVPTQILSTSWTFNFDLTNGTTYHWYVSAVNLSGDVSNSDVASFTTAGLAGTLIPIISSPKDGALSMTNTPTLYWFVNNSYINPLKFRVQVSSDPMFNQGIVYDESNITTFSKVVYNGIVSGSVFYWRVSCSNDAGVTYGAWSSPIGSFTTWAGNRPVVAIPGGPANGMTVNTTSPALGWYQPIQSSSSLTYTLQYTTQPDFSNAVIVENITIPYYQANNLSAGTKYYWKVASTTPEGITSQYSNTAEFIPANPTGIFTNMETPTEYIMSQNYPNPFNPSTTIQIGLPESAHVTLTIYNQLGQVVVVLLSGQLESGYKSIVWNADKIESGVYFAELKTEKYKAIKKLLLMK